MLAMCSQHAWSVVISCLCALSSHPIMLLAPSEAVAAEEVTPVCVDRRLAEDMELGVLDRLEAEKVPARGLGPTRTTYNNKTLGAYSRLGSG